MGIVNSVLIGKAIGSAGNITTATSKSITTFRQKKGRNVENMPFSAVRALQNYALYRRFQSVSRLYDEILKSPYGFLSKISKKQFYAKLSSRPVLDIAKMKVPNDDYNVSPVDILKFSLLRKKLLYVSGSNIEYVADIRRGTFALNTGTWYKNLLLEFLPKYGSFSRNVSVNNVRFAVYVDNTSRYKISYETLSSTGAYLRRNTFGVPYPNLPQWDKDYLQIFFYMFRPLVQGQYRDSDNYYIMIQ